MTLPPITREEIEQKISEWEGLIAMLADAGNVGIAARSRANAYFNIAVYRLALSTFDAHGARPETARWCTHCGHWGAISCSDPQCPAQPDCNRATSLNSPSTPWMIPE